jgi:hypothetical protein
MSIFTILTYAMLTLIVVTGVASLPRNRRWLARPLLPSQVRRVLRDRA